MIHADNIVFANAVNYETPLLLNRSEKYNKKSTAGAAKLAKRMESVVKRYESEDSDRATILFFSGQFKKRLFLMRY